MSLRRSHRFNMMTSPFRSKVPDHLLKCELATVDDVPELSSIWYNTFTTGFPRRLFPWTPAVQKWWDDANRHDMLHNSSTLYVVAKCFSEYDHKWRIIGYIKWVVPIIESDYKRLPRFPPWSAESDHALCDNYFAALEIERWKHIKENQDYYKCVLFFFF